MNCNHVNCECHPCNECPEKDSGCYECEWNPTNAGHNHPVDATGDVQTCCHAEPITVDDVEVILQCDITDKIHIFTIEGGKK